MATTDMMFTPSFTRNLSTHSISEGRTCRHDDTKSLYLLKKYKSKLRSTICTILMCFKMLLYDLNILICTSNPRTEPTNNKNIQINLTVYNI